MADPMWTPEGESLVILRDNLEVAAQLPDASFRLIYLDPPFNTGRTQRHRAVQTVRDPQGDRTGYGGERYRTVVRTLYGYDDRFRGVKGTRKILFMNENDLARLGLSDGDLVDVATDTDDGIDRGVRGLRIVRYEIPEGNCGGYYPEMNVLIPLWHHDEQAKTPAAKAIPVRITPATAPPPA